MKRSFKTAFLILIFLGLTAATAIYVSTHSLAVLDAKGYIGKKEADLILTSSLLMLIVVVPVLILTWVFAWKYREGSNAKHAPDWEHNYIAEYCWWGIPLIIIGILAVITWKSSHELNPFEPLKSDREAMTIQVVALQWKWLFIYPKQRVATLNYVQFPEKTPIRFEITSDAPMNSFWIPQLGGQIYAMPAMRSLLHLIADEPGSYRGVSANLSGSGFAGMTFTANATSSEDFERWVGSAQGSTMQLSWDAYKQLVEPSSYNPVATYALVQEDLFDRVIMKYMMPMP